MKLTQQTDERDLREAVTIGPIGDRLDEVKGVLRRVKVMGIESANGYSYARTARDAAARLFEGIRVYLNHVEDDNPQRDRKLQERFGKLVNVTSEQDGVYADFEFKLQHDYTPQFLEDVKRFPDQFGFSPHTRGRDNGRGEIVDIVRAYSVDLVAEPATVAGLFESKRAKPESKTMRISIRGLVESHKANLDAVPGVKLLKEMMDVYGSEGAAAMDAPVEVAADADPAQQANDAFKSMIMAVLDDSKLDISGKAGAIKKLLGLQEKAAEAVSGAAPAADGAPTGDAAGGGGDSGSDQPKGDAVESKETKESLRKLNETVAQQTAQIATFQATEQTRTLFEAAGVKPTPIQVKACAALPEADRQGYVDGLKELHESAGRANPQGDRPRTGGPATDTVLYSRDSLKTIRG